MLRKSCISVSPPISASFFGGWNPPAFLVDQVFLHGLYRKGVRARSAQHASAQRSDCNKQPALR